MHKGPVAPSVVGSGKTPGGADHEVGASAV